MKWYDDLVETVKKMNIAKDIHQHVYDSLEEKMIDTIKSGEMKVTKEIVEMINDFSIRYVCVFDHFNKQWYLTDRDMFIPKYKYLIIDEKELNNEKS